MIDLLNGDLRNEWKHLRFYLYHASAVTGLHREEYKEFFLKEAAGEMAHVTAFSDVILGLGGVATKEANDFPTFTDPKDIFRYALEMEEEVVVNYVQRMQDALALGGVDGQWLEIFLEGQIQDSREDVDHFRQIVKGLGTVEPKSGEI
jgi:bacterioferritin